MTGPMAGGLQLARQALADAQARGAERAPLPIIGDDLTPEQARAEAEAMRAERDLARWEQVCPRRFLDANWEWVRAEHGEGITDKLLAWAADPEPPNLVLLGPVGTGKSATALLACKEGQLQRGQGLLFHPITRLLDQLRPGGPEQALGQLVAAPRLIVDDLGTERPTDWTAERLHVVVDSRWLEERPTVATSNLAATDLKDAISERTYSRLVGGALVLQLGGEDRRRRRD